MQLSPYMFFRATAPLNYKIFRQFLNPNSDTFKAGSEEYCGGIPKRIFWFLENSAYDKVNNYYIYCKLAYLPPLIFRRLYLENFDEIRKSIFGGPAGVDLEKIDTFFSAKKKTISQIFIVKNVRKRDFDPP